MFVSFKDVDRPILLFDEEGTLAIRYPDGTVDLYVNEWEQFHDSGTLEDLSKRVDRYDTTHFLGYL